MRPDRAAIFFSLMLFLATACFGAFISYDHTAAMRQWGLIVSGVVLFGIAATVPEQIRSSRGEWELLSLAFRILPVLVVVYFVLTNDWTSRLGKVGWLDPALRWLASWQPQLPGWRLDSNTLGGVLATLAPLQIAALSLNGARKWRGVFLTSVTLIGLLLSESRGAWIALTIVAALAALWLISGRIASRRRQTRLFVFVGILAILVVAGAAAAMTPAGQSLLHQRSDRWEVWRNSLDLAGDYPFTGLGLGGFEMAYSSYVLLTHVGHTVHAHNLFLDLWIEQGLLGLLAFVSIIGLGAGRVITALWHNQPISIWSSAALAALGVIVLHGLTDDPFYGYGGIAIPIVFVPLGLLARRDNFLETPRGGSRLRSVPLLGGVGVILLSGIILLPGTRSAFVANLGALSQTRAELTVYTWPAWGIQDELRRSDRIDLAPAIAQYKAALAIDRYNATANRRLGQIELSRGQYDLAQQHLESAYAVAPEQRATRQLLGELYAINGDIDRAVALWKNIDVSEGQLQARAWWYEHLGEGARLNRLEEALAELHP
jgi:tetratricopeptide (TPR) repeat protein